MAKRKSNATSSAKKQQRSTGVATGSPEWLERLTFGLFVIGLLATLYALMTGIHHPISDLHGFRQSQTALTAQALLRGGPGLAYETPVVGAPWSIPFEFPLYQQLVALVARLGIDLIPAGRLVSEVFFWLTLIPVFGLLRSWGVARAYRWVFLALLLVTPEYLFWSRTFMIESTALFFGTAYLYCAVLTAGELRVNAEPRYRRWALGALYGTLGILVKATTFAIFGLLGVAWILAAVSPHLHETIRSKRWPAGAPPSARPGRLALAGLGFGALPFAFGVAWTRYTDVIKLKNVLGHQLTSDYLRGWNFGTLAQRLDLATWSEIWGRTLANSFGYISLSGFSLVALLTLARHGRRAALLSALAFFAPFLIFTNLHYIHNYYQYANAAFVVIAAGWLITGLLADSGWRRLLGAIALIVFFVSGLMYYGKTYLPLQQNPQNYFAWLGDRVKTATQPGDVIIGYGLDWSSELPFYSERRALMIPPWFDARLDNPLLGEAFANLAPARVGAAVFCGDTRGQSAYIANIVGRFGLNARARLADSGCAVYVLPGVSAL